jgi:NADH:ubiquinone oxidoreductase subunit 6 (subunit J)
MLNLIFNISAFFAITFAVMVYFFRSPLYSVFSLILVFVFSIFILLLLKVEFLAYILLLVYVGAITLLFIFVIMLLNLKREHFRKNPMYISFIEDKLVFFVMGFKIFSFFFFFFQGDLYSTWKTHHMGNHFKIKAYHLLLDASDVYIFKLLYTQL